MASTIEVDQVKHSSGVAFTLPTADGSAGHLLKTNGSRVLSFTADIDTGITSLAADTSPQLGGDLDCNGAQIQWSKGADVVSATALAVLTDGNYFDVTGTVTIATINTTGGIGTQIKLHFDGILTLTNSADIVLPGGANITTAAGDEAEFIEYASGDYRCTSYTKASGAAVKIADESIDSDHYVDGSIDNAHIADDAINSEHYADGSIDSAHLATGIVLNDVVLKDYGETTNAIGGTGGGTQDIDLTAGNSVSATVDTSTNTFTFSNPTASDEGCGFTLVLVNGGSQTVVWPGSVDWPGGTAPTLTTSGTDILTFWTVDGGTIWHGMAASTDTKTPS